MAADRFAARRQKLLRSLGKHQAGALLVTNFTNVSYLTGFSGDDSYLLVSRDATVLISDSRYTTQIGEECPTLDVAIRKTNEKILDAVERVVKAAKLTALGFESNSTTVDQLKSWEERLPAVEFVPISGAVEELRQIKDASEIQAIREAIHQAERGFAVLRASLTGDQREREVAHNLEHTMRQFGARGVSFDPIVAVGDRAALPHARAGDRRIGEADFVLVDWGATNSQGYKSDLTRVLVTGKILPKLEKVYKVVLTAQRQAIERIGPGVKCCDVDAVARTIISKANYGKYFGHGLGHGIGLDIHEGPRLGPTSETELKPGMVVTVEPGIYLPGWGGVRIEDDVLVTRDGHEVLTSVPKEFEDAQTLSGK